MVGEDGSARRGGVARSRARGRNGGGGIPTPRSGRRKDEENAESWEYGEDDELWLTDSDAVGTVDAPAEHRPQQQGKALGEG